MGALLVGLYGYQPNWLRVTDRIAQGYSVESLSSQ